jgi:hypothetical protein
MFSLHFKLFLKEEKVEIEMETLSNAIAYEITDRIEYFFVHSIRVEKNSLNINTFYNTISIQDHDIYNVRKNLQSYDNELKIEKNLYVFFYF